jgi:hypothetical protein
MNRREIEMHGKKSFGLSIWWSLNMLRRYDAMRLSAFTGCSGMLNISHAATVAIMPIVCTFYSPVICHPSFCPVFLYGLFSAFPFEARVAAAPPHTFAAGNPVAPAVGLSALAAAV